MAVTGDMSVVFSINIIKLIQSFFYCLLCISPNFQNVQQNGCHKWSRNYLPLKSTWVHLIFPCCSCCLIFIFFVADHCFSSCLFILSNCIIYPFTDYTWVSSKFHYVYNCSPFFFYHWIITAWFGRVFSNVHLPAMVSLSPWQLYD